jgi:2-oxoglutarate ferredoxin oxidoreductase subunit delta
MKLETSGSKDRMSRREFLKGLLPKSNGTLFIDKEKCTGCALCAIDCPTKALAIHRNREKDSYQLLFRQEACNACGVCEKSCPEHCLQFIDEESRKDETEKETKVVFEDNLSRCIQCGIPLFPRSMVRKLEAKIFTGEGSTWELNFCPSCRTKLQLFPSPQGEEGKGEGDIQYPSPPRSSPVKGEDNPG